MGGEGTHCESSYINNTNNKNDKGIEVQIISTDDMGYLASLITQCLSTTGPESEMLPTAAAAPEREAQKPRANEGASGPRPLNTCGPFNLFRRAGRTP